MAPENKDEKIIYVMEAEEIASVVNRLFETQEKKVVFVFPDRSRILSNFINLKLIKREAESLGKEIFVFESDEYVKEVAEMAKIPLYGQKQIGSRPDLHPRKSFKIADIIKPQKASPRDEQSDSIKKIDVLPEVQPETEYFAEKPVGGEEEEEEVSAYKPVYKEEPRKQKIAVQKQYFDEDYVAEEKREDEKIERAKTFFDTFKEPVRETSKKRFSFTSAIIGMAGIALIVFLGVLYMVSAKVSIEVTPKKEIVDFDIEINGKSGIEILNTAVSEIPAQYVKIEKNDVREFDTTGKKVVDQKAQGKITVYNSYSSSSQALVATTRFLSTDGKIFRLVRTVTVPGARIDNGQTIPGSIVADVIADQPGDGYNIGPSDFKIPGFEGSPKYTSFYGKSDVAMAGGAIGERRVVTAEDIENAKKSAMDSLLKVAEGELAMSIPENYKLLDEAKSVTYSDFNPSLAVGAVGDKFSAVVKIKIEAIIFKSEDVNTIIEQSIQERATKDINWSKAVLNYKIVKPNFSAKTINLLVSGNIETVEKVDIDGLKTSIAGKSVKDLSSMLLKDPAIAESKIVLRPSWLRTIPENADKIVITIK
jgi:hypothetical protein